MLSLHQEIERVALAYQHLHQRTEPMAEDFAEFLTHMPPKAQLAVGFKGFEGNRDLAPFRRFFFAQRRLSRQEYMRQHLSAAAFVLWQHDYPAAAPDLL